MQQPQPSGGWIKLHRAMKDNGHLQMPEKAFKIWVYCLLQVNHRAGAGCQPGEGWITYAMIREECCDPGNAPWGKATINTALDYLEDNGYIQRLKTRNGAAMRIRIVNWDKYQGESGSESIPVTEPVIEPVIEPPIEPKQEGLRMTRREEQEQEAAAPAEIDPGRATWLRLKAWLQVNCHPSFTDSKIEFRWLPYLKSMGQEVIEMACSEAALQGKPDTPAYVFSILARWQSKKVRNADDVHRLLAEHEAAKQRKAAQKGQGKGTPSSSTVAAGRVEGIDPEEVYGRT